MDSSYTGWQKFLDKLCVLICKRLPKRLLRFAIIEVGYRRNERTGEGMLDMKLDDLCDELSEEWKEYDRDRSGKS